jgi:hypothetical protein
MLRRNYPWVDIGIAGEHLALAATELGLGTCWIGWIKPRVVAKIVDWPASIKPVVVITVGYPCDPDAGPPPATRRIPLSELKEEACSNLPMLLPNASASRRMMVMAYLRPTARPREDGVATTRGFWNDPLPNTISAGKSLSNPGGGRRTVGWNN